MNKEIIEGMVKRMVDAVKACIERVRGRIDERIDSVEARVQTLEAQTNLKYLGVWKQGNTYSVGSFVTDHGSVWHASRATNLRPGSDDSWTLAVKRGRDAT
jgi:hypothetical protein